MNATYRFNCSLDAAEENISVLEDRSGESPEQSRDRLKDGKYGEDKGISPTYSLESPKERWESPGRSNT